MKRSIARAFLHLIPLASAAMLTACAAKTPSDPAKLTYLNPRELYDPSKYYSHVVSGPGSQRTIFVAGQVALDKGGKITSNEKPEQIRRAFRNLRTAIESAGLSPTQVAKIQIYSVNHKESDLSLISEESQALFTPQHMPASTLVPVTRLALDGLLFEIDATLLVP